MHCFMPVDANRLRGGQVIEVFIGYKTAGSLKEINLAAGRLFLFFQNYCSYAFSHKFQYEQTKKKGVSNEKDNAFFNDDFIAGRQRIRICK